MSESAKTFNFTAMQALRWISVLPGALLASLAIEVAISLFYAIFNPGEPMLWVTLVKSCLGSYLFVQVGYSIAPLAKLPTALALAILMSMFAIAGIWAGVRVSDPLLDVTAVGLPQMVVPGITYWYLRREGL